MATGSGEDRSRATVRRGAPPSSSSWSEQYARRRAVEARYPSVFHVPLARKPSEVLFRYLGERDRLLDVGAGPGRTGERVRTRRPHVEIRTLDVDPSTSPDYRSLDEVDGRFECVLLLEVVEHLSAETAFTLLGDLQHVLAPGGRLLVSTPNVFHPSAYFRDMTHRTPIAYDELGGMLDGCGYRVVEMARIYNAPWVARTFRRTLGQPLHRWLGIDFARSIVAVAEAGESEAAGRSEA